MMGCNNGNNNGNNRGKQVTHPLLVDLGPESVQAVIQWLFDTSIILEDSAFQNFVGALCELSLEMVCMQRCTDVGVGASFSRPVCMHIRL